jgi:ribosomal-protein-alanine N-acetyltransferase
MDESDLDPILSIENMCFSVPWKSDSFSGELYKKYGIRLVAEYKNIIVGYTIGWIVADGIHIANLAVHPHYRYRGIGEQLIQSMIRYRDDFTRAALEVRRSNHAARRLYKKLGFEEVGVRKNYYIDEGEDAIIMVKQLQQIEFLK